MMEAVYVCFPLAGTAPVRGRRSWSSRSVSLTWLFQQIRRALSDDRREDVPQD